MGTPRAHQDPDTPSPASLSDGEQTLGTSSYRHEPSPSDQPISTPGKSADHHNNAGRVVDLQTVLADIGLLREQLPIFEINLETRMKEQAHWAMSNSPEPPR